MRQGKPVDDFNQLKGGTAQSSFGGLGLNTGFGAGGAFRTFDYGMGIIKDGNADAAALGITIGPDTAIAVGEKGDFKFAHPSADITGLIKVIESITDMVRINHGLKSKYKDTLPSSGYSLMLEKMGVIEDNIRRGKLFKEREKQLKNYGISITLKVAVKSLAKKQNSKLHINNQNFLSIQKLKWKL